MAGITNMERHVSRNKIISLAVGAAVFVAAAVSWSAMRPKSPAATEAVATMPTADTLESVPSAAEQTTKQPAITCDTSKISTPSKLPKGWAWTVKTGVCLGYGHPAEWRPYGLNKSAYGDTLISLHGEVMWSIFESSSDDGTDAYTMSWRPDDKKPMRTRKEIESLPATKLGRLEARLLPTLLTSTSPGVESWLTDAFVILPNGHIVIAEMTIIANDTPGDDDHKILKGSSKQDAEDLFLKVLASIKT
jgi:hypothetical protein